MSEEKTFTQEQLDAIIKERLAKEKAKGAGDLAEKEKELARREFMLEARETLSTKGLSADLLDALNTSSKEAFDKALTIIEQKIQQSPPPAEPPARTEPVARLCSGGSHGGELDSGGDIRGAFGLK